MTALIYTSTYRQIICRSRILMLPKLFMLTYIFDLNWHLVSCDFQNAIAIVMEFSEHYYLQAEYQLTNAAFPSEVAVAGLRGMKEFLIFP